MVLNKIKHFFSFCISPFLSVSLTMSMNNLSNFVQLTKLISEWHQSLTQNVKVTFCRYYSVSLFLVENCHSTYCLSAKRHYAWSHSAECYFAVVFNMLNVILLFPITLSVIRLSVILPIGIILLSGFQLIVILHVAFL